jgi:hypothetical protein
MTLAWLVISATGCGDLLGISGYGVGDAESTAIEASSGADDAHDVAAMDVASDVATLEADAIDAGSDPGPETTPDAMDAGVSEVDSTFADADAVVDAVEDSAIDSRSDVIITIRPDVILHIDVLCTPSLCQ